MLSRFLNRSATGLVSMECVARLAAAAYLLQHPRYFYTFTKRIDLDYAAPFSVLLNSPSEVSTFTPEMLCT